MKREILVAGFLVLVVFFTLNRGAIAEQINEAEAIKAAETFLNRLDQGAFEAAWKDFSDHFQAMTDKGQWLREILPLRSSYGPKSSRALVKTLYLTTFNRFPDGGYLLVQFESSFQNKRTTTESVILMQEKNQQWKIVNHAIH